MASPKRAVPIEPDPIAYETDVAAWALEQAQYLRSGSWSKLDIANLADEVEALARTERHVLTSALRLILLHLLKWDRQPAKRTRSWSTTIRTQRLTVAEQLEDNPSLNREHDALMARAYRRARIEAAAQTRLSERTFPEECPYTFDMVMGRDVAWPPAAGTSRV